VYKKKEEVKEEVQEEAKAVEIDELKISDAGTIVSNAASNISYTSLETYYDMQKDLEEAKIGTLESKRVNDVLGKDEVAHKGLVVQVHTMPKEESKKDSVDVILDTLRSSNTFKCDASYMTMLGGAKGSLVISPCFLIFDPDLSPENKTLIPVFTFRYFSLPLCFLAFNVLLIRVI
jgi:hypothetical protein